KGLVLRLGRYRATVGPGLTFLMPVIEDILKVDMRERVINVEPQKVITKDNVSVIVDAVIYYRISDPVKATFEVQNFAYAATTLAQTNLRNLIGDKSLDETLTARDTINANLRNVLDEASKRLDVLNNVLAQQTKFIVPSGSDLVNVLGLDDKSVVPVKR